MNQPELTDPALVPVVLSSWVISINLGVDMIYQTLQNSIIVHFVGCFTHMNTVFCLQSTLLDSRCTFLAFTIIAKNGGKMYGGVGTQDVTKVNMITLNQRILVVGHLVRD